MASTRSVTFSMEMKYNSASAAAVFVQGAGTPQVWVAGELVQEMPLLKGFLAHPLPSSQQTWGPRAQRRPRPRHRHTGCFWAGFKALAELPPLPGRRRPPPTPAPTFLVLPIKTPS